MKKAIVFAGGGSKGAYQIGVWKALNELGEKFDIAAGTSIGSINAGFYVQHDFDAAYEMWKTITAENIMASGLNLEKDAKAMLSQREQLLDFVKDYVAQKGADVTPFHDCLKKYFNPEKFAQSDIGFALMTTEFPSMTPVTVTKEDIVARGENGWEWLAASAAAFPVFPTMKIDSKSYIDGGFYDNFPVSAAIRQGARRVLIVYLKPDSAHGSYTPHPWVDAIRPTRDLGTFLNFERHVLDRSIRLGYTDAMKHYGRYYGRLFTFIPGAQKFRIHELADDFIEILTLREAAFRSREKYHFQMGSKDEGCIPLLKKSAFEERQDSVYLFFSALELYMSLLGFDDTKEYDLEKLLADLRESLLLGNTPEDFGGEGFDALSDYIRSEYDESKADVKATEDDRVMLIASALAQMLMK